MADLDGDGKRDMISGEYWPGNITWFRGIDGGHFAKGELIPDAKGDPILGSAPWKDPEEPDMDSLAAAPWLVDWDADGDLDLLIGNIAGRVVLVLNEGDAKRAKFVRKGPIEAGGKVLDANRNDAGPTTADWDRDGLWDLIVGCGDGAVLFFRNVGTKTEPRFAAAKQLLGETKHEEKGPDVARSGSRAKPHVCDWNGDGKLDLLIGDFANWKGPEPVLDAEQVALRDKLLAEQKVNSSALAKAYQAATKAHDAKDQKAIAAAKAALTPLEEASAKLYEKLRPLQAGYESHGFVWVYLGKK